MALRRATVVLYEGSLSSNLWAFKQSSLSLQRQFCITNAKFADDNVECGRSKKVTTDKAKILKEKTPIGKLEDQDGVKHPYQEKDPLPAHPGGVNPDTGEVGGPRGPEPTRYGDWERKGRVTDF